MIIKSEPMETKKQLGVTERLKKPTPKLFRVIRNLSGALSAASISLLALPFNEADWLHNLAQILAVTGIITGIVAQSVTTEASE